MSPETEAETLNFGQLRVGESDSPADTREDLYIDITAPLPFLAHCTILPVCNASHTLTRTCVCTPECMRTRAFTP